MDAFQETFRPKYSRKQLFSIILSPIFAAAFIWAALTLNDQKPLFFACAVMFTLGTLSFPFHLIRRVRLGERLIVDRYLLPSREFEYSEVLDVGAVTIKTSRGNISLNALDNVSELKQKLATALAYAGSEIEGELVRREARSGRLVVLAAFVTVPIGILLALLGPPWLWFAGELSFLLTQFAIFYAIYALFHQLLPRRTGVSKQPSEGEA